ncbi:hypothetical protein JCM10213_004846 [Rhodosporidiobolus nylandii]
MASTAVPIPPPSPSPSHSPPLHRAPVSVSPSQQQSSYTQSLPPTYRRSTFPVSPAPFVGGLLPGLGIPQRGCSDDDDFERAAGKGAGDALGGRFSSLCIRGFDCPAATADSSSGPSSKPSSRKSSASSFDSFAASSSCGSGAATPASSLASSVLSDACGGSSAAAGHLRMERGRTVPGAGVGLLSGFDWGVGARGAGVAAASPATRSLSVNSGMDKAKREAVKGWEDPALAAARRALWDDPPDDAQVKAEPPAVVVDEDEGEEADEDEAENEDEWILPPVRPTPSSTLSPAPLHSCLRASPSSRSSASLACSASMSTSFSSSTSSSSRSTSPSSASHATSSSGGGCSVTFSADPPLTCETYSAAAYSRRGDAPVEKLSIREWMELQGVREAVGLWSGRIQKWDEVQAELSVATGASTPGAGAQTTAEREGRTPCPPLLAAVRGVVQVARSTPNSPVERSPVDAYRSLPHP